MRLVSLLAATCLLSACAAMGGQASPVPDGGTLIVANKRGASLSRIDLATGAETHRQASCENPHELTVSPDAQFVLVACYSGRTLELFSTRDLAPLGEIELGEDARVHSAIWLENGVILAGAEGRGSLYLLAYVVDGEPVPPRNRMQEIGGGGPGPHLVAADLANLQAWGTIIPTGEVVRYDLEVAREEVRSRIGTAIEAIALSPDGTTLWVSSNDDNVAYRLDAMTLAIEAQVATGEVPIRLAMHPSGAFVVSSNYGSGDLTVIDTASNAAVRTIPVSRGEAAAQVTLVFNADGTRLYAAETATDTIAEIDFASGTVLRRLATGPGGDGLAIID